MMLNLTDWQNKKYKTTSGTEVVILTITAPGPNPIVGYLYYPDSSIVPNAWSLDGKFDMSKSPRYLELVNAKTKHEGWVNIARLTDGHVTTGVFTSKEDADNRHRNLAWGVDRIACVRIEWEE